MALPGPLVRPVRRFLLGSGPLKRRSDRVECVARVALLLVVLLSAPAAVAAGGILRSELAATARQQAAERTPVTAVVTADAVAPADAPPRLRVPVPARWTTPGGAARAGEVPARSSARAGDRLTLWLTPDGRLSDEPMTAAELRRSTLVLAGLGWAGVLCTAVLLHVALRRLLDHRRDRRWTRGWAHVEPAWSRRVP